VNPLLCLDFDGVLALHNGLDRRLIGKVARLVSNTDARVVLSTNWRHGARWQDLRDRLVNLGMPKDCVVGETPILDPWNRRGFGTRGHEIATYLLDHEQAGLRFAILDDWDTGVFDMAPVRPWFVQTDERVGVKVSDCRAAEHLMTEGPPFDPVAMRAALRDAKRTPARQREITHEEYRLPLEWDQTFDD
jgi:hypothetical protein